MNKPKRYFVSSVFLSWGKGKRRHDYCVMVDYHSHHHHKKKKKEKEKEKSSLRLGPCVDKGTVWVKGKW